MTGEALARALAGGGRRRRCRWSTSGPPSALAGLGEQHDARMIVVGSYGESPIKGAILGSTPHKLLHLSDRPVLVVPGG